MHSQLYFILVVSFLVLVFSSHVFTAPLDDMGDLLLRSSPTEANKPEKQLLSFYARRPAEIVQLSPLWVNFFKLAGKIFKIAP